MEVQFKDFKPRLEYNINEDAAFCLVYYLFNIEYSDHKGRHDSFTTNGIDVGRKMRNLKSMRVCKIVVIENVRKLAKI